MNHYETLGISPQATPEEVKQAFRRCARDAHPDRDGGSVERMQAVNRANEVLGDPERRAEYDRTGIDAEAMPLEQEARNMLMQLFQAALDGATQDIVGDVRAMLKEHARRLSLAKTEKCTRRERLIKYRDKVRVKSGENLYQGLVDSQVAMIEADLALMDRGLAVNLAAGVMVENYESVLDQSGPKPPQLTRLAFNLNNYQPYHP